MNEITFLCIRLLLGVLLVINSIYLYGLKHQAPASEKVLEMNASVSAVAPSMNMMLCTTVKNHEFLTLEWVAFHRLQGVDHFIIYVDDDDEESGREELQPFVDLGLLTLLRVSEMVRDPAAYLASAPYAHEKDWVEDILRQMGPCQDHVQHQRANDCPQCRCQIPMSADCMSRAHVAKARWVAHYDIDEFMFRPLHPSATDTAEHLSPGPLWEVLDSYGPRMGAVTFSGLVFGFKGLRDPKDWEGQLMIQAHTLRLELNEITGVPNRLHKCRPEEMQEFVAAQKTWSRPEEVAVSLGYIHMPYVTEDATMLFKSGLLRTDAIRFNHYQFPSLGEATAKATLNLNDKYLAFAHNLELVECSSAIRDNDAALFAPKVQHCMMPHNIPTPSCAQW